MFIVEIGVFQALENIENFKQVKISSDKRSLQWLNGIDLCKANQASPNGIAIL